MSDRNSMLYQLGNFIGGVLRSLLGAGRKTPPLSARPAPKPKRPQQRPAPRDGAHGDELAARKRQLEGEPSPGQLGASATYEVRPPSARDLTITYTPTADRTPDAGEIVWTWIPYEERDGRGKDRPVLVIARLDDTHVYAVRLTSKSHDRDRDFVSIGSGAWDVMGRESWLDIDQLYSVHVDGMRREAAALDRARFQTVATALRARYGWNLDL